jgi:isopenicillin-N N-acyltransferase-like protein
MSLPVIRLTGTPHQQGVAHGRILRERIAHNLQIYFERFEREVNLSRPEVLTQAGRYATAIEAQNADYFAGMRGVAEGSGFSFGEIAALNVRYEILYYQFGKNALAEQAGEPPVDGCTAFAVLPGASDSGHLLMGQNWDWIPEVLGAVLRTTEPDGFETLAFTEAGIVGAKIGLNSARVGLAINGMTTTDDDWSRLARPVHVRCYEVLRARRFDSAAQVITGESRACSTNFLIAQAPDRVVDIEAAPDRARLLSCQDGCLVHTNHFMDPAGLGIEEPPNPRRPYSCFRLGRLRQLLLSKSPISVEDIQGYLQDHQEYPFGVCRHENPADPPEQRYITVTGVVMDLDTRTLHLTDGPPCQGPYQTVSLA